MEAEKLKRIREFQVNELTEYEVYTRLSKIAKDRENSQILAKIARDEMRHYMFWKKYTGRDVPADRGRINRYMTLSRLFGLSFGVKLMELGEEQLQKSYADFSEEIPNIRGVITDEDRHERETLKLIHDQYLKFAGSIVLGFNDALVELTGALAGLTFALRNANLIAVSGLVTGIAAALSMAASEFLSLKAEDKKVRFALRSSVYTGIVYLTVVLLLVLPFLLLENIYVSLSLTLTTAILIVAAFSFYISIAQQVSFRKQFSVMVILSMGVALISFVFGIIMRNLIGIDL